MIYDYRDEGQKLPRCRPRVDLKLPFRERLSKHTDTDAERVSPAAVKKRVGAIQALLSFARGERWIADNAGPRTELK